MKSLRYYAIRFIPALTFLVFFVSIRGECPPEVLYVAFFGAILVAFRFREPGKRMVFVVGAAATVSLILAYLMYTHDFRYFLRVLSIYLGSAVLAGVVFKYYVKKYWVFRVTLLFAFIVDLLISFRPISELFSGEIRNDLTYQSREVGKVFPFGMASEIVGVQAVRFPELISSDLNFMGTRYLTCEWQEPFDREACHRERFVNQDWSIWTYFVVRKEFSDLFKNREMFYSVVDQVLPKLSGVEPIVDQVSYAISPGHPGVSIVELNSMKLRMTVRGSPGERFVLPVFPSHMDVTLSGLMSQPSSSGLLTVILDSASSAGGSGESAQGEVIVKIKGLWAWAVLLFWLPGLLIPFLVFASRVGWFGLYDSQLLWND